MTLRQLREARKLTQEQLGELSGIKQTHISQIELGKVRSPQYVTVAALAKALKTSPASVAGAISETVAQSEAA